MSFKLLQCKGMNKKTAAFLLQLKIKCWLLKISVKKCWVKIPNHYVQYTTHIHSEIEEYISQTFVIISYCCCHFISTKSKIMPMSSEITLGSLTCLTSFTISGSKKKGWKSTFWRSRFFCLVRATIKYIWYIDGLLYLPIFFLLMYEKCDTHMLMFTYLFGLYLSRYQL